MNPHQKRNLFFAFLLFITFFNFIYAQRTKNSECNSIKSPIYSNITHLISISDSNFIASGNQIIINTNTVWKVMHPQPPLPPSLIEAVDLSNIWVTVTSIYQESKLYFFNGEKWQEIFNPLANTVTDMKFIDTDNGIIGGLGEIAVFKKGRWNYLPPPTQLPIKQVIYTKNFNIYTLIDRAGIYKYESENWKYIPGTKNVITAKLKFGNFYAITDSIFGEIKNDSLIIISKNKFLNQINSFDVGFNNSLTAVGNKGIILNYKNGIWEKQNKIVKVNLNSIALYSNNSGWIVGDNGTILSLGNYNSNYNFNEWKGFRKLTIYLTAKSIDDEYGVVANDFNNDGELDFFTCGLFEADHLYINQGNNKFSDEAEIRGVAGITKGKSNDLNLGACTGDIDNDGEDDLYVTVLNGKNKIFKNTGNGYFVDYSSIAGGIGENNDRSNSCIMGDVDNDGDLDLFITNESSTNRLYLNNGAGIFTEATINSGLTTEFGGMGCSFGDIDNDGDIDLYIANWSSKNLLYRNQLIEKGKLFFNNITENANVGGKTFTKSNGVVFSDIDNDGDLDLYVTNRKTSNTLYLNDGQGFFSDVTKQLIGNDSLESYGAVIEDFDGDGFKDIYLSNVGENKFYKNINNKYFNDETSKYIGRMAGYSTGSAFGDIDDDGDLDIYAANFVGEGSSILVNKLNDSNYVKIKVRGVLNNTNAIGTKIYVYETNNSQKAKELFYFSEISGGSGYSSMNQLYKIIHLRHSNFVDVKVVYPNGLTKYFNNIRKGATLEVNDIDGFKAKYINIKKGIINLFLDPHKFFELIKWLIIISLIGFSAFRGLKRYSWSKIFVFASSVILLTAYNIQYQLLEYENFLYSSILPITSIFLIVLLIHLYYGRERIKKLAIAERQNIKEKLSRDLHDDLASTISSIGIYLTLIRYELNVKNKKISNLITKAESLIGDASSSITDLIWAFKPKAEFLTNLIIRVKENFSNLFREQGINLNILIDDEAKKKLLSPETKQNLYLIIKEVLNNILKYAEATNVSLNINNFNNKIVVQIIDDGKGFDIDKATKRGNGLTNMRKRAEEIEAEIKIISKIKSGTEIKLILE